MAEDLIQLIFRKGQESKCKLCILTVCDVLFYFVKITKKIQLLIVSGF